MLAAVIAPAAARCSPEGSGSAPQLAVEILDPSDGATISEPVLKVQVAVRAAHGAAVQLQALVDGKRVPSTTRGFALRAEPALPDGSSPAREVETLHSLEVDIPRANCTLAVSAQTSGATRTSAPVRLNWRETAGFVIRPKLYVLAVGISAYREADLTLRYASKDASDFAQAFAAQAGGLYEQVQVRMLLDQQATRDHILDGLQWLQRQTTAKDVAILFLAGHGIEDPSSGVYYFVPHDADSSAALRTMISKQSLQTVLGSMAGKALLFLDTCHAASVMSDSTTRAVSDVSRLLQELSSVENGLVIYAAASGRQLSQESPRWGNGAFTKAVVEGVLGRAAYHAGRPITAQMLNLYVSERVKELTSGVQTPIMVTNRKMADFPLALQPLGPPAGEPPPPVAAVPATPPAPPVLPPAWELPPAAAAPPVSASPGLLPEPLAAARVPAHRAAQPVYKRAWFWLTLGGVAAALSGGIIYAAVSPGGSGAPAMNSGGTPLSFTKIE